MKTTRQPQHTKDVLPHSEIRVRCANALLRLMHERRLTQRKLATLAGVGTTTVNSAIRCTQAVGLDFVEAVALALHVDPVELLATPGQADALRARKPLPGPTTDHQLWFETPNPNDPASVQRACDAVQLLADTLSRRVAELADLLNTADAAGRSFPHQNHQGKPARAAGKGKGRKR